MFDFIKKVIARFFIVIGVLTCINIALLIWGILSLCSLADMPDTNVKPNSVLILNTSSIRGDLFPETDYMALSSFFGKEVSLIDTLTSIRSASKDMNISGIFMDISELNLSYAQAEELRSELLSFKASGKPVYIWSDTYGEAFSGTKNYWLATAADKIFIQPAGTVTFNGISSSSMFIKNLLEKLEIEPIGAARKEYKTYWNMFSEEKFTEAHKESTEAMINSIFSKVVSDVADSRGIAADNIRGIADSISLSSQEGLEQKLLDGISYRDDALSEMKTDLNSQNQITLSAYTASVSGSLTDVITGSKKIAVIEVPGSIHRGKSDVDPSGVPTSSGAKTVISLLEKANSNKDVVGIIMRVNSPGGSVIASETIWHEIEKIKKENKKPLIISMGSVAASGGYYVSMGADRIFADHSTITGSIGVVIGKFYTKEFFENLGITFDTVSTSKNNGIFSSIEKLSPEQEEYISKNLDETYNTFVQRAAEGRKMEKADLEELAHGRVWTGGLAQQNGLVDEIGGFMKALDYMREETFCFHCSILKYPKTDGFWSLFTNNEEESSGTMAWFGQVGRFLSFLSKNMNAIQREMNSEELYQSREDLGTY